MNNKKQAIMSIKPEYTRRIFAGKKLFEFRRKIWKGYLTRVLIYETSPTSMVVGEFTAIAQGGGLPKAIWEHTYEHAGISKADFDKYFKGRHYGNFIEIGNVIKYPEPRLLEWYGIAHPPQNFCYVSQEQIRQAEIIAPRTTPVNTNPQTPKP